MIKITYLSHEGESLKIDAKEGSSVMQTALDNSVPGIVGECSGVLACATCHVYVDEAWRSKTGEAGEFEKDMLEGAIDPRDSSRLACQIKLTPELDGLVVHVPAMQI